MNSYISGCIFNRTMNGGIAVDGSNVSILNSTFRQTSAYSDVFPSSAHSALHYGCLYSTEGGLCLVSVHNSFRRLTPKTGSWCRIRIRGDLLWTFRLWTYKAGYFCKSNDICSSFIPSLVQPIEVTWKQMILIMWRALTCYQKFK